MSESEIKNKPILLKKEPRYVTMSFFERFLSRWFTKYWIQSQIKQNERSFYKQLNALGLSLEQKDGMAPELENDLKGYKEWLTSIEDREMVEKAKKMDIYLDSFPYPEFEEGGRIVKDSYYRLSDEGVELLCDDVRIAIRKAMRERAPSYRKERREAWELWLKAGTLIMGILGVATGFVAVLKK